MYLTATSSPTDEADFYNTMCLKRGDVCKFRDSTTRKNVVYSVVEYDRDEEEQKLRRIVEEKKARNLHQVRSSCIVKR